MTVAEIKKYIKKQQEKLGNSDPYEEYAWYDISAELTQIGSMLDELEGAIEQIKWERDIAVQQLNELGYNLGEKIWYDMLEDKPKEEEDVLIQLDDDYYIAHYEGVVYATDEKETEIWGFEDFEYTNDELEDFYKVHRWRKIRSNEE